MATPNEQLLGMRRLQENWDGYGAAAPQAHVVDLAEEFAGLIEAMLRKSMPGSSLLHLSPTRTGGVLIEWEDLSMEHEVELCPDGSMSFLHSDKATGQIATRKISPGPIHVDFLKELHQLVAA